MSLADTLKVLGYDNESIRKITAAADAAEIQRVEASRAGLQELLTPIQCASQSPRIAAQVKRVDSEIYHASGCTWRLPTDGSHVNVHDVDKAIRNADIDSRMRIKSTLAGLKMIA